jgi:hypothetical protein
MEADCLEDVAGFYTCHHRWGHDVEWMWGDGRVEHVEIHVANGGEVSNLPAVVGTLESVFHPAEVPAELVYETCLNGGATKQAVETQLQELPTSITERVGSLD